MRASEIADIIETLAPLPVQEGWDNAGFQTHTSDIEITGVLLCVDVSEAVIDEAIAKGCNMVISHHPLIFRGLKRLDNSNYISRCVIKAVKNDIAVYAAHTNMDKVIGGVSDRMCKKIGLLDTAILCDEGGTGLGMYGNLPEPLNATEFLELLKDRFACKCVKHSAFDSGRTIRKVAVCGGSGAEFIGKALEIAADAYVSADIKYHEFFMPEGRMLLADIGHYESEQYTKEIFFELISKKMDKFAIHFSEEDTNPVFYF